MVKGFSSLPSFSGSIIMGEAAFENEILLFYLEKPLKDQAAVTAAAEEMYLFCFDVVDQGTYTLKNLEMAAKGSPFWFFWWD